MSYAAYDFPYTEFERDPSRLFHLVTGERVTIVIEDETGKKMELRPAERARPTERATEKIEVNYEALKAAAGSWSDVDAEALIKHLYESRTVTTRPLSEL